MKHRPKPQTQLTVERLENLDLPSSISFVNGTVLVWGSNLHDTVRVEPTRSIDFKGGVLVSLETRDNSGKIIDSQSKHFKNGELNVQKVQFVGGEGNDKFFNNLAIPSEAWGQGGSDTLWGGSSNDILVGGEGHDYLYGNGGYDRLWGENGNDFLDGGDDWINDMLDGGKGYDTYQLYYHTGQFSGINNLFQSWWEDTSQWFDSDGWYGYYVTYKYP
jgi:hypothetical protein